MRGPLRDVTEDLLSESVIRRRGLFDPIAVQRLLADLYSGKQDLSLQIFFLLTLEIWFREFVD